MEKVEFPFDAEKLFEKCVKNQVLPKNDFKKQAILIRLIKEFEDIEYTKSRKLIIK